MTRAGLKAAAAHCGLSVWELRAGALSGKYPAMRIGGARGKFWFDLELLDAAIEKIMLQNLATEPEPQRGVIRHVG